MTWTNWVGNQSFSPASTAAPHDEDEVAALVRQAAERGQRVRVAGAGHSFTPVVRTDGSAAATSRHCEASSAPTSRRRRATALPGTLIRDFYEPLWEAGLALRNQGDIDTQQIAGAVATGTHGSGHRATLSLSGVVRGVRLVTATGDVREIGEADARPAARGPGLRRHARGRDRSSSSRSPTPTGCASTSASGPGTT